MLDFAIKNAINGPAQSPANTAVKTGIADAETRI
jgi:hypothetical protein